MTQHGYYQRPTIHGDTVVFTCEDDLWSVSVHGGVARRITANPGRSGDPHFSPDGSLIAFTGRDEGHPEIYVMAADGGDARRLTYLGADTRCCGFTRDGRAALYATNAGAPFGRVFQMGRVPVEGGLAELLPLGPAAYLSFAPGTGQVLGRHTWDPARWKRYRGGTAGQLWVDPEENGRFKLLLELEGNTTRPLWVGERIYFGSDHEGICNLYSCLPDGTDLRRHTHHEEFYLRYPSTDGQRIVYQMGADLYLFEPEEDTTRRLEFEFHTPRTQRLRKFVNSWTYFEDYDVHPEGHSLVVVVRGRPFVMANWEQAVVQLGERDGVRYRMARFARDGTCILMVSDRLGEEHLEAHPTDGNGEPITVTPDFDLGRPLMLEVAPRGDRALLTNHRHELLLLDIEEKTIKVVDRSPYDRIAGAAWSPDGKWVAYSFAIDRQSSVIRLHNVETGETHDVTRPQFKDIAPSFDPEGRYLYFLSYRDFDPVYDNLFFELSFPKGMKPYAVTLRADLPDPFLPVARAPGEDPKEKKEDKKEPEPEEDQDAKKDEESKKDDEPLVIDFDGIEHRVIAFPVPEGRYGSVVGLSDQVLFTWYPVEGSLDTTWPPSRHPAAKGTLASWDLKNQEKKDLVSKVTNYRLSSNRKTLAYRSGYRLRLVPAGKKPDNNDTTPGRKTGYVDLGRVRASVQPSREWAQMFREAWRLMRDHFWAEDMAGVDWEEVYHQYLPILERVGTRFEFSDLLWEFQGELGTSHAYEYGGDYRSAPYYSMGKLAADFAWDEEHQAYRIAHVPRGDSWDRGADSPLNALAVNLSEGDLVLAVDGQSLSRTRPPQELLVYRSDTEVVLTVKRQGKEDTERVVVKALRAETPVRYRAWVEGNRQRVHERTEGKVGYIHIPNMSPDGFAEFHRGWYSEMEKDALIIDVRYNGGGHVSQLLLEKLSRRRLGYDFQRWGAPVPYPQEAPAGPLVALTNEQAGSDGDIFSHCFKMMGLGPLIGKRTWGGVIGIWPRHRLVDGTTTTQPEFSFWFDDVGWRIENYGTEPDEEVDITPQDWREGRDPQLEHGISRALELLEENPPHRPQPADVPRRVRPKLPGS